MSRRIKVLTNRLEKLQRRETVALADQIKQLQTEINALLEMEDLKWKQRAKLNWLTSGNKNTKVYHAWAS